MEERKIELPKQLKERVQIGTDEYGKPIYKWASGTSKQDLLISVAKLLCESGQLGEKPVAKEKHLFREYAQHWFEVFKKPTLRPLTAQNYLQQLNRHLCPAFGEMFIEDITPEAVQGFFNARKHLAQETQQKQMNILRMILDMAVEDGLIRLNPVKSKKVRLTSNTKTEREPLTREEMLNILRKIPQIEKVEERCFIAIQALHAMRPCEVLGLKWEDIDLNKGVIHIRRNVVHPKRNRPVVGDTKTKLSKRVLTISQIALPYIQEAERRAGGRSDFVFGGREPLSYTQHRQMMNRISNQMNIKGITGYTFRHTVITDIYETTHDANIASAVAGHSKTSITMNRYSHTRQDAIRKGIDALDKTYNL